MSFVLTAGFSGHVTIENHSDVLFKQNVSSFKEAKDFIDTYGESVPGHSLLRAAVIPLRTDNWKDFAKDFFYLLSLIMRLR